MSNLSMVFDIVNSIWRSSKLDPSDEGTARVWNMAIKDLSTNAILLGCEALARSEDKFSPNPGRFRRLCLDATEQKRQADLRNADQQAYATARQNVAARSPKEAALAATRTAYLRRSFNSYGKSRIAGVAINMIGEATRGEAFDTDFDWEYVARSAALPASDDRRDHEIAWAELLRIFNVEWGAA